METNITGNDVCLIRSKSTGKVLDVQDKKTEAGSKLIAFHYFRESNQHFTFKRRDDGAYRITALHSGRALNIAWASYDNGAAIIQWGSNEENEWFYIRETGDGYVKIISTLTAKAITVNADNDVVQWEDTDSDNQKFEIININNREKWMSFYNPESSHPAQKAPDTAVASQAGGVAAQSVAVDAQVKKAESASTVSDGAGILRHHEGKPYVFISYSSSDISTVRKDVIELQKRNVNIWFDEDLTPGNDWFEDEVIPRITSASLVLFYVSEKSLRSPQVLKELKLANKIKERDPDNFTIVPINLLPLGKEGKAQTLNAYFRDNRTTFGKDGTVISRIIDIIGNDNTMVHFATDSDYYDGFLFAKAIKRRAPETILL